MAFRQTCNVRRACEIAKVGRSSHYRWLEEDPEYREAFELAKEQAGDLLESEAIRRAFEGVVEPTGWYKGEPGAYVRRYSDTLLIFLLKGAMPEKYHDRVELGGSIVGRLNFDLLPDDIVTRIAAGEHPAAVLSSWLEQLQAKGQKPPAGLLPAGKGEE